MVQRGGESRALAEAREFRAGVMQGDAQMLRTLQQAYRPVMRRLTSQIDDLTRLIAERARAGAVTTPGSIVRLAEYREMAAGLERALDAYGVRTTGVITARQRALIVDAVEHARGLAGAQLPRGVDFDALASLGHAWAAVDADALEVLVGAMRDGSTLSTYLRSQLVRGTIERLTSTLEAGMLENPRVTAQHMKIQMAGGMVQALRVARTETLRAYREAERAQYEANDDLVRGYRRIATLDDRTCAACYLMDGVLYPNDRDLDEHVQGRCFPAGTLASGPAPVAATTRYYRGDLVTIRTASGVHLSFTPNHPILTRRGWVAGGLLVEGDEVFRSADSEGAAALIDKDDHQMPTRIEQVAGTLSVIAAEMPTAPEDFHGDGVGSDVHVVRADRLLWGDVETAFTEPVGKYDLDLRPMGRPLLAGLGASDLLVHRHHAPAAGGLRHADAAVVLGERRLFGEQAVGVYSASSHSARLAQPDTDRWAGHIEGTRQTGLGLASGVAGRDLSDRERERSDLRSGSLASADGVSRRLIAPKATLNEDRAQGGEAGMPASGDLIGCQPGGIVSDRVIEVSRRWFSGHVYNLQTRTGWYFANGIVAHNCFTVPELVPLSALGIRGVQAEPLVRAEDTGRARFLRADESEQRRIVGNNRLYGLWADGRIPLNGIVGWTRDPVWGDHLATNSAVRALDGFMAPRIPAHDTYWRPRA